MTDIIDNKKQWEEFLLSSFFNMVRAPDGDFAEIDQLVKASSDSYTIHSMVERLSRTPQGKAAFKNRLSLGCIDPERLEKLPLNTLGYLYVEHMRKNQLKSFGTTVA